MNSNNNKEIVSFYAETKMTSRSTTTGFMCLKNSV